MMVLFIITDTGVDMRKLLFVLLLCFGTVGATLVHAAGPAIPDKSAKEIQRVVRAQLDAFAADDAKRAFSFAASNIQEMFGSADQFMQMVRGSYPVVYRPASVTFLTPKPDGKTVMQPVAMTDGQGGTWIAMYRLEQQKNKSWRIAGCVLVPNSAQTV